MQFDAFLCAEMLVANAHEDVTRLAMAMKAKAKSDLLAALHETSEGLERLGFIDHLEMIKIDALCLDPAADA